MPRDIVLDAQEAQPLPRVPTRECLVPVQDKEPLRFRLAKHSDGEVTIALSLRKCGSTLLNTVVNALAAQNGVHVVDMPGRLFGRGLDMAQWDQVDLSEVLVPGNHFSNFRQFPAALAQLPGFVNARKVFMFRDPRDALVTEFYADAYSQPVPSQQTEAGRRAAEGVLRRRERAQRDGIDAYVLTRAQAMAEAFRAYRSMLDDPSCLCLRYEEFVFQKRRMIHQILRHFGWVCPPVAMDQLMRRVDVLPRQENEGEFIRQVIPGDHQRKLSAATIQRLNGLLQDALDGFDYP